MPAQGQERPIYQSGMCEIDLARRELRMRGTVVPMGTRAFDILQVLVQAAGELVTKGDLMDRIWAGAIVGDNALQVHISAVRKALGPLRVLLKTESGRGYRLMGSWTIRQEDKAAEPQPTEARQTPALPASANLPAPASGLIGRTDVMRQLQDLLSAYRVITLTGPGGIGKTTLAIELARNALASFEGGGWLAELATLSDPALVPSAVAGALGLTPTGGAMSAEAVARAIGERQLLLVLDNCEHVIDAAAQLAETIVRLCPGTTVLATSREVLRIDGEYVYRVPPLAVPAVVEAEPDNILDYSAVALFVARTKALRSDFQPQADDLVTVAGICRHLDGIPLAIEFAAARAATLGLAEVASHLDDRFRFLTGGRRTALPRQQTLRAVLDWSYELLPDTEQQLLRYLAVFSGGFPLDAAVAVMRGDAPSSVAEGVANLVAKSLLTRDASVPGGRWRLLETIRLYAFEKLTESGEAARATRRHAAFFRDLFGAPTPGSPGQLSAEDVARYSLEIDNVRAALDWAFSARGDVEIAITLTIAVVPLWLHLSLMEECRERVERALDAVRSLPHVDLRREMRLTSALAVSLMFSKGLDPGVVAAATRALEIAEKFDSIEFQLRSLWRLWSYYIGAGECRAALRLAEKFSALAAARGDAADQLIGERILGVTTHYRGDQPSARHHLEHMLSRYVAPLHQSQLIRFQRDQGMAARGFLARVLWLQGFHDQAMRIAQTTVEEAQATNNALTLCPTLAETACPIALEVGDLAAATHYVGMLLDHSARHALVYWNAWGRSFEAELAARRGDAISGLQLLHAGFAELGDLAVAPRFIPPQGVLAEAFRRAGLAAEGLAAIDAALAWCERTEGRMSVAALLAIKGELVLLQGEAEAETAAEDHFRQSLDWARRQGAMSWELRAALSLARLRVRQGRADNARDILAPVYDRFTEGFETADLRAAKAVLDTLSDQPSTR